jgi:hypothetical protein
MLPLLFPGNTSDSLSDAVKAVFDAATAPFPPLTFFSSVSARTYPSFWDWYKDANGPLDAGSDVILGSRLLDQKALTGDGNASLVKETLKIVTAGRNPLMVYLVAGKGVRDARPRDGGNSVSPAWRRALVHAGMLCLRRLTLRRSRAVLAGAVCRENGADAEVVVARSWNPFDAARKARQEDLMSNTLVAALRRLAPDMGAYVNEVCMFHSLPFLSSFWRIYGGGPKDCRSRSYAGGS